MAGKLGFGFMRLPLLNKSDQTSFDYTLLNQMVDAFLERGFTYFDTALTYHGGLSEEAIRKSLVERHPRESFTVATKLPPRVIKKYEDQEEFFNSQLRRCGVAYFNYYLIHNVGVSAYRQAEQFETFGFVREKKREDKIKKVGMSFHDTPELLDEILVKYGDQIDFVQLQINYIDWENLGIQSRRCWEVARKHAKPIVVMEPLKGGNLAVVPEEAEALMKSCAPDAPVPSWALRFAASQEGVFMVLSGMNTMEQVLQNTDAMRDFKPLSREEYDVIAKVTAILNANTAIACTACRYCEADCPNKIAIPDYFALYNSAKRAVTDNISSQFVYYMNLAAANHGRASDCIGCKRCERACPQHLPVVEHLKAVSEQFDHLSLPSPAK